MVLDYFSATSHRAFGRLLSPIYEVVGAADYVCLNFKYEIKPGSVGR